MKKKTSTYELNRSTKEDLELKCLTELSFVAIRNIIKNELNHDHFTIISERQTEQGYIYIILLED